MNIYSIILICYTLAVVNSSPLSIEDFFKQQQQKELEEKAPTTTRAPLYGAYPPNTNLCFPDVGCFTNTYPFNYTANFLPLHPDELNTELLLYTRKNQDNEDVLSYLDVNNIQNTNYNTLLPLKIIIHGFSNNRSTPWIHTLKKTILKQEAANVLVVAWGNGALFPLYNNASSNIRLVGKQLGMLINKLRDKLYATNPRNLNIHCIGHSLGAHACAFASNSANIRFNRISGMDPAGPFFEDTDPVVRLDPTDADLVDAIHTNGGSLFSAAFGILMPVGHVDFYVNGGKFQPGCPGLTSIIGGIFGGSADPTKEVGCSHNRVIQLYTESITSSCPFIAFSCNSEEAFDRAECTSCTNNKCSVLGYYTYNFRARGSLYLKTNPTLPYCGYHHSFEIKINDQSPKSAGELLITVDDGSDKSVPKPLTKSSDDLNPGETIRRTFVTEHDLINIDSIKLTFNKKSKPFFGSDPNSNNFNFDKVKVTNLEINEDFSRCLKNAELNDKQTIDIKLEQNDCIL